MSMTMRNVQNCDVRVVLDIFAKIQYCFLTSASWPWPWQGFKNVISAWFQIFCLFRSNIVFPLSNLRNTQKYSVFFWLFRKCISTNLVLLLLKIYSWCSDLCKIVFIPWVSWPGGVTGPLSIFMLPSSRRALDVDRTRLLFNSAKIPLDISMNYTSKGTFNKSADIEAFLDIESANM